MSVHFRLLELALSDRMFMSGILCAVADQTDKLDRVADPQTSLYKMCNRNDLAVYFGCDLVRSQIQVVEKIPNGERLRQNGAVAVEGDFDYDGSPLVNSRQSVHPCRRGVRPAWTELA